MPASAERRVSSVKIVERPFGFNHEPYVVAALLELAAAQSRQPSRLASSGEADALLRTNGFAFFVAVLLDQMMPAERAFDAPRVIRDRLGKLDPQTVIRRAKSLARAMHRKPMPYRYPATGTRQILSAAARIVALWGGRAENLWADEPSAQELIGRLREFEGIGQKKAAMAVEILERELGVPLREMDGSDVAVDVHIRRVFVRSGLAPDGRATTIIDSARRVHPARPGALDSAAWLIGREWCRPRKPLCDTCPIAWACRSAQPWPVVDRFAQTDSRFSHPP